MTTQRHCGVATTATSVWAKNHHCPMKRRATLVVVLCMKRIATMKWTFGKELAANGALGLFASMMLALLLRAGV
jgi:hypothetical protein